MSALWSLLRRDLLLALRRPSEVLTVVFFFVVVAALFPLAVGPERATLPLVAVVTVMGVSTALSSE